MPSQVYFALSGNRVKIGYSANVERRLEDVGAHLEAPLALLGTITGGYSTEHAIHAALSEFRLKGEWFRDCADVRGYIDRLLEVGPEAMGLPSAPEHTTVENSLPKSPLPGLACLMWPLDAVAQLRGLSGATEETVRSWLAGASKPPLLVRLAFSSVVLQFMHGERLNFIGRDASKEADSAPFYEGAA